MQLSVAMIVRDEEASLPEALRSCEDLADEIVVVDTGSADRTPEIAAAHPKVKLERIEFEGFSAAKQAALDACAGDWVLVLDADERVSPELATKIRSLVVNRQHDRAAGFRIRRRNWILGREMTSMGLQRDYPLRLFRREGASYNARPVHEAIDLPAGRAVGRLDEPIEHYTFAGIDHYLRKIDLYTDLELAENPREHSTAHLVFVWPSTFVRYYLSRGGWKDGFPGFFWAALTATGKFLRDMKVWIAAQPGAKTGAGGDESRSA